MSELLKQTIEKIAAERFPNDADQSAEFIQGFLEGFDKQAANFVQGGAGGRPSLTVSDHINKGMGEALGKGVIGLGLTLGAAGVAHLAGGIKSQVLHNKFLKALVQATNMNVILKGADREKLLSYGETLFKYAPNVATDPNMLAHLLSYAIQGEGGMDAQIIRLASDLENRYQQNTSIDVGRVI